MAELSGFGYRPGSSLLHKMDVRFKVVGFALISLASVTASVFALVFLTFVLAFSFLGFRLPFNGVFQEMRYLIFLLALVFIARSFSTEGTVLWQISSVSITREGLQQGALMSWRLLLICVLGLFMIVSTRPWEVKASVEWFLKPIPRLPEKRVATMMGLMVRCIPLIFNQAREMADAQRARCIENRKNPMVRLTKFAFPLMRRCFQNADHLAVSMEARCYNENRKSPAFAPVAADWKALVVLLGIFGLSIMI